MPVSEQEALTFSPYHAHQAHIVGDVPAHAAQAHGDLAGIGICGHQRLVSKTADVHVHAANNGGIAAGAEHIALSGDVALAHEVVNMHAHAGAGDAELIGQLLLGDHGVCLDALEDLSFTLGHGIHLLNFHWFLINILHMQSSLVKGV